MRIAYVCADRGIPVHGTKGASIHVRGVAVALSRAGHEVKVLATRTGGSSSGFPPTVIDFGFDPLLKKLRIGIAAAGDETLASESLGLMLNTGLRQQLDALDAERPVDAVYERYSLWSWAGLQFARERGVPYVLEVNAPLVEEQRTWRNLSLQPVATAVEQLLLREADIVTVPAHSLRQHVRAVAGGRRRVYVLPNGVDLDLFSEPGRPPEDVLEHLEGRFVVAFLGSLKPWHGIEPLWRGFMALRRRVPAAHLLVIGDGPMRAYLEKAAAAYDPDAVTLTGAVEHRQVPALLAAADVGVAPYPRLKDFYFCPLKIVEYLAAGLPVVASRMGDVERLVQEGRTGLLVPPGDHRALAAALVDLYSHPRRRRALGARARARAQARHGWQVTARRLEELIELAAIRKDHARHLRASVA